MSRKRVTQKEHRRRSTAIPIEQCLGWSQAQFTLPADPRGNRYQRRLHKRLVGKR